jgi:hypothetical protein
MQSPEVTPGSPEDRDPNRHEVLPFPTLNEVISSFMQQFDEGDLTPWRVQIGVLGSREVTYKVWVKEQEESLSGVIQI